MKNKVRCYYFIDTNGSLHWCLCLLCIFSILPVCLFFLISQLFLLYLPGGEYTLCVIHRVLFILLWVVLKWALDTFLMQDHSLSNNGQSQLTWFSSSPICVGDAFPRNPLKSIIVGVIFETNVHRLSSFCNDWGHLGLFKPRKMEAISLIGKSSLY